MAAKKSKKSRASGRSARGSPGAKARSSARARAANVVGTITPRRIEAARRKIALQVEREREQRIASFRAEIGRDIRALRAGRPEPLRILAEGDSWFDYPTLLGTGGGIITHLQAILSARILNLANAGDEVREMMALKQRQRIESMLADRALDFRALLFSGGGNDIVGDHFVLWLKDRAERTSPLLALDRTRLRQALAIVEMGYRDLITLRDRLNPACVIFTHVYDFPQPSDKGVCGFGPWLKPGLDYRGWTDAAQQFEIVRDMLGEFATTLLRIEREASNFIVVRTQGLLSVPGDWHNEIHPNRSGYRKLAEAFRSAITSRFKV